MEGLGSCQSLKRYFFPRMKKNTINLILAPTKILIGSDGSKDNHNRRVGLCSHLAKPEAMNLQCPGYLEDSDRRYYLHPEESLPPRQTRTPVLPKCSLGMAQPRLPAGRGIIWPWVLATSFVQLKDTPWISSLRKSNVEYPRKDMDDTDTDSVHLDQPYVRRLFGPSATAGKRQTGLDAEELGNLGIMLLELCFRKPIEKHGSRQKLPDDGGNDSVRTAFDLIAALEWLKEVNVEAGADYADAVEWCLAGCQKQSQGRVVEAGDVRQGCRATHEVPHLSREKDLALVDGHITKSTLAKNYISGRVPFNGMAVTDRTVRTGVFARTGRFNIFVTYLGQHV
jgi:hypothetical protein